MTLLARYGLDFQAKSGILPSLTLRRNRMAVVLLALFPDIVTYLPSLMSDAR